MGTELAEQMALEEEYEGLDKEPEPFKHTLSASERQVGGSHYKDMRIQPTTFIEQNGLSWCEGNAVKYICRHRIKGTEKDILKAIHYLELLLQQEYCYVRPENLTA